VEELCEEPPAMKTVKSKECSEVHASSSQSHTRRKHVKAESCTAVILEQSAKTVYIDVCGNTVNAHSHYDHGN